MALSPETLMTLPVLAHLPQVTLTHLATNAQEHWFGKREVVLQKDGAATGLLFLLEGRLQGLDFTNDGREVGLYFINPGDYFGEVALIDSEKHPEYVTALAKSRVILLPRDIIRPILFGVPKIAETLCRRMATRLRQDTAHRRILGLPNPLQRVCAQLELMWIPHSPHIIVPHAPTHQELAIMINSSRETVTRVFQLLQGRGAVERDGNSLQILRPDFIHQIATGQLDVSKHDGE
ncbi:Crp/Fnr family transcriptional regulator [Acidovorax temperans]|uniref:Crp/Fnr family transcriptional regulator n=1 Tax=Acidovorax temperans TaxID=80878 RepID=UPI0030D1C818